MDRDWLMVENAADLVDDYFLRCEACHGLVLYLAGFSRGCHVQYRKKRRHCHLSFAWRHRGIEIALRKIGKKSPALDLWAKVRSGVLGLGEGQAGVAFNGGHGLKASQLVYISGRGYNKEIPGWVACEWGSSAGEKCAKDCRPESEPQKWAYTGQQHRIFCRFKNKY